MLNYSSKYEPQTIEATNHIIEVNDHSCRVFKEQFVILERYLNIHTQHTRKTCTLLKIIGTTEPVVQAAVSDSSAVFSFGCPAS